MTDYLIEQKITAPLLLTLLKWNLSEFKPKDSTKTSYNIKILIFGEILKNWVIFSGKKIMEIQDICNIAQKILFPE